MTLALFDDLFIPDHAATAARGLRCLRDAVPDALEVVVHLEWWKPRDERNPGASGDWAYLVCAAGLHFGARQGDEWQGWEHKPRNLIPWGDLRSAIADDPRRPEVIAFAESLPMPKWKDLYRPFELWPHPEEWHPSYLNSDRERPRYADRMHAWGLTQAILNDAADRLEASS